MNFKIAGLMVLFLLALGGVTWATEPWVVDENTLALYHCEETEGTTVEDDTGDYDGTASDENLLGSATSKVGEYSIYPDALYYFSHGTILDTVPETGTVEMWINPDVSISTSHTPLYLFSKYSLNSEEGLSFYFASNGNRITYRLQSNSNDRAILSTARTWTSGTWYHVCGTWGDMGMQLYIDGVLEAENENYTEHPADGTFASFQISGLGWSSGSLGYEFDGKIDEIRVSDIQRDCTTTSPTTTTTTSTTTTTVTTTTTTTTLEPTTTTTLEPTTTTTVPGTTTTTLAPSEDTTNNSYLWIILLIIGLFLAIVMV